MVVVRFVIKLKHLLKRIKEWVVSIVDRLWIRTMSAIAGMNDDIHSQSLTKRDKDCQPDHLQNKPKSGPKCKQSCKNGSKPKKTPAKRKKPTKT